MKRSLLTVAGILVLALAVPGAALAHHGHGRHHHRHHHGKAHARHAKFRLVHIGSTTATPVSPSATPPTPENAGTVASYTNGVLTLTLNDGSTVSGKVTNRTRIGCVKATPTTAALTGSPAHGPGDDNGQGDDRGRGDMGQQSDHGSGEWRHGEHGDDGDSHCGGPGASEPPCDSSALVAGAVVRAAELRIGPGGAEFESVLLVR
jgi:hypothetical protein